MTPRRRPKVVRNESGGRRPGSAPAAPLTRVLNLGPVSSAWLLEIGVRTLTDVERIGSVEICRILRSRGHAASLNLAYALEGALMGVHWTRVPAEVKSELRRALGKGGR